MKTTWIRAVAITIIAASSADATIVDLTAPGASGRIHGAIFEQQVGGPVGTGALDPFLRLEGHDPAGVVEGFNTTALPRSTAVAASAPRTHALRLGDLATIDINGTTYRKFVLAVTQADAMDRTPVTLADLKVFVADRPDLASIAALGTPRFDLNSPRSKDNTVLLDPRIRPSGGGTDMIVLIPGITGDPDHYLYLYAKFTGSPAASVEWAARKRSSAVPEPSSIIITLLGLGCLGGFHLRRSIRSRMDAEFGHNAAATH